MSTSDENPGDEDTPVSEAYGDGSTDDRDPPEFGDDVLKEALSLDSGPGYPEEVEKAWEETPSMTGEAPSS